jgi:phosphohistidine swiveling domain-containing protein
VLVPRGFVFGLVAAGKSGRFGITAEGLRALSQQRFLVPRTALVSREAQEYYIRGDPGVIGEVRRGVAPWIHEGRTYAVLPSTLTYYLDELSLDFPFIVRSGLKTPEAVASAVEKIFLDAARIGGPKDPVRLGVVIQEEVPATSRGVAFSLNPLTGTGEVVVEVAGTEDRQQVDRWVWRVGEFVAAPRDRSDEPTVRKVVERTRLVADTWRCPIALEWAQSDPRLYWLRVRSLKESPVPIYSSTFSRSFLPGPVKPLVWSINSMLVNGSWARLLEEISGKASADPGGLARLFYFQSYFNLTALRKVWESIGLPSDSLERMMGIGSPGQSSIFRLTPRMLASTPRLTSFTLGNVALSSRIEEHMNLAREGYQSFQMDAVSAMTEDAILARVDELFALTGETSYFNILTPITALVYERLLRGQLERGGIDLVTFDLGKGLGVPERRTPEGCLLDLRSRFEDLDPPVRESIRSGGWNALASMEEASALRDGVRACMDDFGYVSGRANDFSATPWREDPEAILRQAVDYSPLPANAQQFKGYDELKVPAARRPVASALYSRARRYRALKEEVSALFTYGYGLFRQYFLELGQRFVRHDLIEERSDVYFLTLDEVRQIVAGGCADNSCNNYRLRAALRKRDMEQAAGLVLPEVLYGEESPPLELLAPNSTVIHGLPVSRGYFKGPVKIVAGKTPAPPSGDSAVVVLASGSSGHDAIGNAGALIVAEGGLLSDAAVGARRRGIPAVVLAKGTIFLAENADVAVDGYTGTVVLSGAPPGEKGRIRLRMHSQAQ